MNEQPMSDKNLWVLKPFRILERESYANPYKGGLTDTRWRIEYSSSTKDNSVWQTGYIQFCDNAHADEMFQPLDVESLTTQLRAIAEKLRMQSYVEGCLGNGDPEEPNYDDSNLTSQAVAEVLELIGVKGKDV